MFHLDKKNIVLFLVRTSTFVQSNWFRTFIAVVARHKMLLGYHTTTITGFSVILIACYFIFSFDWLVLYISRRIKSMQSLYIDCMVIVWGDTILSR